MAVQNNKGDVDIKDEDAPLGDLVKVKLDNEEENAEDSKESGNIVKENKTTYENGNNQTSNEGISKLDSTKTSFAVPLLPSFNDRNSISIQSKITSSVSDVKDEASSKTDVLNDNSPSNKDLPYSEPSWGGISMKKYSITVLKDGVVKDSISLENKSFITFGRLDDCNITMDHPSCSRYHAVLQYCIKEKDIRKEGFYLYDLASTHGTYLNKEKIKPKVFSRVRVGYQLKFGGSSRLYIVEGPPEDQEEEIDVDIMREKRRQYLQQKEENKQKLRSKKGNIGARVNDSKEEDNDIESNVTWGFGEDAVEEHINLLELFEKKKEIEVKDPKKTLRSFFEREGLEFEYEMSQHGSMHIAKVRLPIETADAQELVAEGSSSNKKEAVLNCATDACKLIQAYDMMQNKCKENQNVVRQRQLEANDFYDSEDDSYLDRTGAIEKKRIKRKKRAGIDDNQGDAVENHESLIKKLSVKESQLAELEEKLHRAISAEKEDGNEDSLDDYMVSMKHRLDKNSKMKLKREILTIKKEIEDLKSLIEKTKPALPAIQITKEKERIESFEKTQSTTEVKIVNSDNAEVTKRPDSSKSNKNNEQKKKHNLMLKRTIMSNEETETSLKKQRTYTVSAKPSKTEEIDKKKTLDDDYSDWVPPENQTGDGRTHLNDKYGY